MKIRLGLNNAIILPNGVDLHLFRPLDKKECRQKLGWEWGKKYLLFVSNSDREEKNIALTQTRINRIKINPVELKVVYGVDHKLIAHLFR
jgi:glycosyltransferase involved in cell wall biosynthesis